MRQIYLISTNPMKAEEANFIMMPRGFEVVCIAAQLNEPISMDLEYVVRAKTLDAYRRFGRPVLVEHGGLAIDALNGLPGCLSKHFVDILREKVCDLIAPGKARTARAISTVGYCDGRRVWLFTATLDGEIASAPRGTRDYYYDSIFVPRQEARTLAEMSIDEKVRSSHVRLVYEQVADHLEAR